MILNVADSGEDIVSGDVAVDGIDELQSEIPCLLWKTLSPQNEK